MIKPTAARLLIPAILTILVLNSINADTTESRRALVIGNGAYHSSPLKNPVNDAEAVGAKLSELGFAVTMKTDVTLSEMETLVRDFTEDLKLSKGTGLFFYAGHAVQVNGYNYLIPLGAGIEAEDEVAFKAFNSGQLLEKMESAGNAANLIILDACRDNPFAASFRSSSRGLSMVEAPAGSLIAYATAPGKTAADGDGEHGVFTSALLNHIEDPGTDVEILLRDVRADVIRVTEGKQTPWTSSSLVTPFYFADSELILAKIAARKEAVMSELTSLNREIERLNEAQKAAESDSERRGLELEQEKHEARMEAARLEAEQLKREEERQRQEAARRRSEEAARTRMLAEEKAQQEQLLAAAEEKRHEMEALKRAGDDPDILLGNINALEESIKEIERSYASAWSTISGEIAATYRIKQEAIDAIEIDPWESDAEFQIRIDKLKNDLNRQERSEQNSRKTSHEQSKEEQLQDLKTQLAAAVTALESKSWTLSGSEVKLTPFDFNRDLKEWPFRVESLNPAVPYTTILSTALRDSEDLRADYQKIDRSLKSSALFAEITYGYDHKSEYSGMMTVYDLIVKSVRIIDLLDENRTFISDNKSCIAASFSFIEQRNEPRSMFKERSFSSEDGALDVYYRGAHIGTTPFKSDLFLPGIYPFLLNSSSNKAGGGISIVSIPEESYRQIMLEAPLVFVHGGTFNMGDRSGDSDEKPAHSVSISSSFHMGKYELTTKLYRFIRWGTAPANADDGEKPATGISWFDAVEFCNQLSLKEGLDPVYRINETSVYWDREKNGYRLPTEAEWEYAARGGAVDSDSGSYAGNRRLDTVGWSKNNSGGQLHPVGQKAANELGIYDMNGNVWEWCWDWYGEYSSASARDPQGPWTGETKVLRSGDFNQSSMYCDNTNRYDEEPEHRSLSIGLRLVRNAE